MRKLDAQMAVIIAFANQKGGVAKTTTVHALAEALGERGRRVLMVDLDPQACLTFANGLDPDTLETSLHDVLMGRAGAVDVLVETEVAIVAAIVDRRRRGRGPPADEDRSRVRAWASAQAPRRRVRLHTHRLRTIARHPDHQRPHCRRPGRSPFPMRDAEPSRRRPATRDGRATCAPTPTIGSLCSAASPPCSTAAPGSPTR